MVDIEFESEQYKYFRRHLMIYIVKIYASNSDKKAINRTILAKLTGKPKQRVSKVVKELELVKLVESKNIPELQKKGGKNKFIFLTEQGIKLYAEHFKREGLGKIAPIVSPIPEKMKEDLNRQLDLFNTATNNNTRSIAIDQIYNIINHLNDLNNTFDWSNEKELKNWIRAFLENPDKYRGTDGQDNIKQRIFSLIPNIYRLGYFDIENFKQLKKYYEAYSFEDDKNPNYVNEVAWLIISVLTDRPEYLNKEPYNLFIMLFEKTRHFDTNLMYFPRNYDYYIKQLSEDIKEQLKKDLNSILKKETNPQSKDAVISEFLRVLRQRWAE